MFNIHEGRAWNPTTESAYHFIKLVIQWIIRYLFLAVLLHFFSLVTLVEVNTGTGIRGSYNGLSSSSLSGFSFLEGVGLPDSLSESVDASASAPFRYRFGGIAPSILI